jgi:nitroreductase
MDGQAPDFFELARTLRAHRAFTTAAVTDDQLTRILDAAVRAPSAENTQPWHFVVVRDQQRREAIAQIMQAAWAGYGREWSRPRLSEGVFADVDRGFAGGLARAPVMIVVCGDTEAAHPDALASSIFPAVQNLLLAAHALGLGAVLTTIAAVDPPTLRAAIDLPDTLLPMAVVPIGHPARALGPSRRVAATDKASLDSYGSPFPS